MESKVCGGRANNDAEAAVWWVCARSVHLDVRCSLKVDKGARIMDAPVLYSFVTGRVPG